MFLHHDDDKPALVDLASGAPTTYAALRRAVDSAADDLGRERTLVFLFADSSVGTVTRYLACLERGAILNRRQVLQGFLRFTVFEIRFHETWKFFSPDGGRRWNGGSASPPSATSGTSAGALPAFQKISRRRAARSSMDCPEVWRHVFVFRADGARTRFMRSGFRTRAGRRTKPLAAIEILPKRCGERIDPPGAAGDGTAGRRRGDSTVPRCASRRRRPCRGRRAGNVAGIPQPSCPAQSPRREQSGTAGGGLGFARRCRRAANRRGSGLAARVDTSGLSVLLARIGLEPVRAAQHRQPAGARASCRALSLRPGDRGSRWRRSCRRARGAAHRRGHHARHGPRRGELRPACGRPAAAAHGSDRRLVDRPGHGASRRDPAVRPDGLLLAGQSRHLPSW